MITNFSLKDIGPFRGQESIPCWPLTILVGGNGAGKSTVIGSLHRLSETFRTFGVTRGPGFLADLRESGRLAIYEDAIRPRGRPHIGLTVGKLARTWALAAPRVTNAGSLAAMTYDGDPLWDKGRPVAGPTAAVLLWAALLTDVTLAEDLAAIIEDAQPQVPLIFPPENGHRVKVVGPVGQDGDIMAVCQQEGGHRVVPEPSALLVA